MALQLDQLDDRTRRLMLDEMQQDEKRGPTIRESSLSGMREKCIDAPPFVPSHVQSGGSRIV